MYYLRIPWVRTVNVSENCPTPTAFKAAKRTVYDVYCLREVITNGPSKKTQIHINKQQSSDNVLILLVYLFRTVIMYRILSHWNQCLACYWNSCLFPLFWCILPPLHNKACNWCSSTNRQAFEGEEDWPWAGWDCHIVRYVGFCCEPEERRSKIETDRQLKKNNRQLKIVEFTLCMKVTQG